MSTALKNVQKFFPQVTTVVGSGRDAKIEVTPADVRAQGRKKHRECAMAEACKRKFDLDGVIIAKSTAFLIKGDKARRFILPNSVQKEIVSFDRGSSFEPGEYILSKVPESAKIGSRTRPQYEKNRTVTEKRHRHVTEMVREALGSV